MQLTQHETHTEIEDVKCLVWDLDHTIWHGILSENTGITLRTGILNLLKELDQRGILLSIASKNNFSDAMEMLKKYKIDHYFLYPQISWNLKSQALKNIKESLNIGYDSIAFIDDQDFEREEVQFVHPKVRCYNIDKIANLLELPEFNPRFITDESGKRRQMYLDDQQRDKEEVEISDNQAFLATLNLEFIISEASLQDLQRVEELTRRTNQLNATGYTFSYDELVQFMHDDNYLLLVAELKDKYGSYGKIGVVLIEQNAKSWTLKLLLMSCRVMSRGVGTVLLHHVIKEANAKNKELIAEFFPTEKNRIMYITYKFAGFQKLAGQAHNGEILKHSGKGNFDFPNYINVTIK